MTPRRRDFPVEQAPYQETVTGCTYVLREELMKNNTEDRANYMISIIKKYADEIFCKHLYMTYHLEKCVGPITRMKALNQALHKIVSKEWGCSPTAPLFRSMKTIFDKPDQYEHYLDKGVYGAVANLFYAAANEKNMDEKFLRETHVDKKGAHIKIGYF